MAVPLAWRVAIRVLGPSGGLGLWRAVQTTGVPSWLRISDQLKAMIADEQYTDEELSARLSAENGYPVTVATYTGDFETRRVQLEFALTGPNVIDEDVRICTFHLVKLVGGLPSPDWVAGDFTEVSSAFATWWQALDDWYVSGVIYDRIKLYKEGPNIVPPQPPVYEGNPGLPGLVGGGRSLPPQLALSVTEQAGAKKNWGRFYLPAPSMTGPAGANTISQSGRPDTAWMSAVADATDTLYQSLAAVSKPVVIYRATLPADRPTAGGGTLPERPANAQTVDQIQIDDVWDVVRSRRYENVMLRIQRAIGSGGGLMQGKVSEDELVGDQETVSV